MELNKADRSLKIKIAYYGPAIGGKTTNLQVLYQNALSPRRGDFVSINSQQDRTILCDLLPLRAGGFCGFDVKLQLLAMPGHFSPRPDPWSRTSYLPRRQRVVYMSEAAD